MTKLLVGSDLLLNKNKAIRHFVCNGLDHFIENGNRFLMTSRKPLQHLFETKLSSSFFVPTLSLKSEEAFRYTDVSCLNGLFLYDAKSNLLNFDQLDFETVQSLLNYTKNRTDVETCIVTSDGEHYQLPSLDGRIVGSVKFRVEGGQPSKKIKVELRKLANKFNLRFCFIGKFNSFFEYDIRSPRSVESNQKEFLKRKYGIDDKDVFNLDREDHNDIQKKIKEFMRY